MSVIFLESFIVNSAHVITANRPMKGLVAFVPTCLDRNEDQVHPGEVSA